jgi:two-component system, NarL family, nitrate/nitrite response regulator NarL
MPNVSGEPVLVFLIAPPMECWGLERLMHSAEPRLRLVGTAASLGSCGTRLQQQQPHVVVLDLDDAGTTGPLEALHGAPEAKLVVLTSSQDPAMLDSAMLAGARGVVRKSEPPTRLLKAIELVHGGELWIDRGAMGRLFMEMARRKSVEAEDPERRKLASLTLRERKTIAAITSDVSVPAKVIAARLCISEHTLRNHLTSVYAKLGLANRLDLYAYATRHGLNRHD